MPKISIVVVTRNKERAPHLEEALGSIGQQTFSDYELVLLEDKERLGLTYNLNLGLERARGEYIARLDDDDFWSDPEKLKKQVEFLDQHTQYVLVGTRWKIIDQAGQKLEKVEEPLTDEEIRRTMMKENPFGHSTVLFRRQAALDVGGYDERYRFIQDYDLWMKLGLVGKLANLPDYAMRWRRPEKNNQFSLRFHKAKILTEIMWRHRRHYPGFLPFGLLKPLKALCSSYI